MIYSMNEGVKVAQRAAADIEAWLRSRPDTVGVRNVENDPSFQKMDVDLIVTDSTGTYWVGIKGDCWHTTGNFFFETHSNRERVTLGCFMYGGLDFLLFCCYSNSLAAAHAGDARLVCGEYSPFPGTLHKNAGCRRCLLHDSRAIGAGEGCVARSSGSQSGTAVMWGNFAFPRSHAPPGKGASRFAFAYRPTAYLTTGNKRADAKASELGSGGVGGSQV
jgi:hypothetical protein